ncbi:MAG: hypothetical protein CVV27_05725 [Candidatus Melainabacteria bacterium HGW-Melainabacteria-1]|nr:MAG: hypothetical protein CVV27_05725 [Candidatus Melainabacteria bacterium HGW-Melainabacteria-1]
MIKPTMTQSYGTMMDKLESYLIKQQWRQYFSEQEWYELLLLSQSQRFELRQHVDYWSRLLISWDTRSLAPQRKVYAEIRQILDAYLDLQRQEHHWQEQALEPLRLHVAETQIELQQKQLLFWRFEYEQRQERVMSLNSENDRAQAEFYNLSELTQFVSQHLKEETELIHDGLDGLMGVLDANWTALYLQDGPNHPLGTLYTLHQGCFAIEPEFCFPREGFWQAYWQTEVTEARLQDFYSPEPDLEALFPRSLALLTQTLQMPDRSQGMILACSEEKMAFSGFRQLFNIFGTHIASSLQNARLHAQINELAIRDSLTGIYNRHHLEERMRFSYDLSRRYGRELSVLMVDIDHFKSINDTYGHQVGDQVLREVADLLKHRLRSTDIIGRYGGEEFMAVLQETGQSGAEIVSQDLVRMVERTEIKIEGEEAIRVTISVGYAAFPVDALTIDNLIAIADKGLYLAKHAGRNQVGYAGQCKSVLQ